MGAIPQDKKRESYEDWSAFLVAPAYSGDPTWAALFPGRGYKHTFSARADEVTAAAVSELQKTVPGLSESAAVRFLLAVGIDGLRAVRTYAPAVVEDAVRPSDSPSLNACRLAASVCPIVVNSVEAVSGGAEL